MTTLNFKGKEYNVVLIDPSIVTAGDGATPSTALKDLPSTLANNTCYLVRRTSIDYAAVVKTQVDTTLVNVMLLGMPKETDEQWIQDLVPSTVVNSAWKSDTAEYANIEFQFNTTKTNSTSWNKSTINAANLEDLTCINCYLHRNIPTSTTTGSGDRCYLGAMFTNNGDTNYKTNFRFYGCKFGSKTLDLDDDELLASMENISSKNKSPYWYDEHLNSYILAISANSLILKNCIVNHAQDARQTYGIFPSNIGYLYQTGFAFGIQDLTNMELVDTKINSTWSENSAYSSNGNLLYCTFYVRPKKLCKIQNVKKYHIFGGAVKNYGFVPLAYIFQHQYTSDGVIDINGVELRFKNPFNLSYDAEVGEYVNSLCGIQVYSVGTGDINIENIYLYGAGSDGVKISQACALHTDLANFTLGTPKQYKINNINVHLSDEPLENMVIKFLRTSTPAFYDGVGVYKDDNGSCINFRNMIGTYNDPMVRIGSTYSTSSSDGNYWYTNNNPINITNLNINAPYTWLKFGTSNTANLGEIRCGLHLGARNKIDIQKLTFDALPNQGIMFDEASSHNIGNNYLRVRNYVVNSDIQDGTTQLTQSFINNGIFIDKSNVSVIDKLIHLPLNTTNCAQLRSSTSQICCPNMLNDGGFVARNATVFAESWGVTREGSKATASLKMNRNDNSVYSCLQIGSNPYKGFSAKASSKGEKNLIAYFAHKGFDDSYSNNQYNDDFNLEILVPRKDASGKVSYEHYYSSLTGEWLADNSVWNDEDCVSRKIVTPIIVTEPDLPIEVKINYSWYHTTGFVYLDPEFHIEDRYPSAE